MTSQKPASSRRKSSTVGVMDASVSALRRDALSASLRAFGVSPEDVLENHLSLLYAHLRDDCKGPAAKYINIEILPKALPIVSTAWSLHPMHRRSELDLEAIRKHIWYDANLQKTIRDVAKPYKHKPIPKSLEEPKQESVDNANSGT